MRSLHEVRKQTFCSLLVRCNAAGISDSKAKCGMRPGEWYCSGKDLEGSCRGLILGCTWKDYIQLRKNSDAVTTANSSAAFRTDTSRVSLKSLPPHLSARCQ